MSLEKYIAVDIGGTSIKYGIIDGSGKILENSSMPTEASKGGAHILEKVLDLVEKYRQRDGEKNFSGVCISSAGMVDTICGEIAYAGPTIPSYAGTAFRQVIGERFGLPCEMENDVNCAGLAEYEAGAGRGTDVMLALTIGTGIGGCAVIDGKILHGHMGSACEVGYLPIGENGTWFERMGATSVLTKKVEERKGQSGWNGGRIFDAIRMGDAVCIEAVEEMCEALGKGIATACYVLNPQVVVLGGGVMAQSDYLIPRIRKAVQKYLIQVIAENTEIVPAAFENQAGMLGAFYHFHRMQRERRNR